MTREEAVRVLMGYSHTPEERAALETLIPELRESEDERIRKELIGQVEKSGHHPSDKARWIAYLEKQKEHQNNSDAPNESSWTGMISSSDKDKNLDEIAQDYVEAVKEYNPEPTWDLMQTAVCYGYHYREEEEQKPAWSEEDEKMLDSVIRIITQFDDLAHEPTFAGPKWTHPYTKELNFLEKLRNGEFQPKQEWSEEDEKTFNLTKTQLRILQSHLSHAHSKDMSDMEYSSKLLQIEKCVSWLDIRFKSLRKPSEVCYGAKGDPDPAGVWKPSEEQVQALEYVIRDYREDGCNATANYLQEILDHLKNM